MIKALKYLKLLKWSAITILFMNLFFIVSGLGFLIYYGKTTSEFEKLTIQLSEENLAITKTLTLLDKPSLTSNETRELWNSILNLQSKVNWSEQIMNNGLKSLNSEIKHSLRNQLIVKNQTNFATMSKAFLKMSQFKNIILIAVILSFILGIILPLIVISLFVKKLQNVQHQTMYTIKNFVKEWKEQIDSTDKRNWQNPIIWAQILTVMAKSYSALGNTPISIFLFELAEIILTELKTPTDNERANEDTINN